MNGYMNICQRKVSSTSSGDQTADRLNKFGMDDEPYTKTSSDVSSGTTPYTYSFRKDIKQRMVIKQVVLVLMIIFEFNI